jgi:hypothetical protein
MQAAVRRLTLLVPLCLALGVAAIAAGTGATALVNKPTVEGKSGPDFGSSTVTIRQGGRLWFTKNTGLQRQSPYYTTTGAAKGAAGRATLILDPNEISKDGSTSLSMFSPDPTGTYVAYGLSATLYGELTVDKGRIVEDNFHTYPILRLAEMPKVETVIVPSYDFWGGVGEPTICVVAPAVLNAIHAATGKPMRTLPLRNPIEALKA